MVVLAAESAPVVERIRKRESATSSNDGRHVVVDRKAAPRRIRVMPASAAEFPAKRRRGRPKCSLDSKKPDTLLCDKLERLAAVVVLRTTAKYT